MADTNNNLGMEQTRSTDSNLPILFANGYPTSLEKMSCEQLELFIPFLVKCSRHGSDDNDNSVPKWWPSAVDFRIPLAKPKNFKKSQNWENQLRQIVRDCYEFHQQPFLLKYSRDLCENEPANLRYVKASDSTTSLFSRHPKKLLLTFRNENMFYDKKKRMTLWKKSETPASEPDQDEIESTFDIMLCDYCDAEFYSDEAYAKHEKKCGNKSELGNTLTDNIESIELSSDDEDDNEEETMEGDSFGGQNDFMAYFALRGANSGTPPRRNNSFVERSLSPKKKKSSLKARREIIKREKDLERAIPFSSPAGIVLTAKARVDDDYIKESLREIESDCLAKPNTKHIRVKHRLQAGPENAVIREMRKVRHYYWPKRHFRSISARTNFEFLNRRLVGEMKPCSVVMENLQHSKIRAIQLRLKAIREEKERARLADCVDLCSDSDEDALVLDDCVALDKLANRIFHKKEVMPYGGSMFGMFLQSSQSMQTLDQRPSHPFRKSIFFTQQSESTSMSSSYQQFEFNTASSNVPQSSPLCTEASETIQAQHSIQQWIQNVSSESFNISNQVTVINTN